MDVTTIEPGTGTGRRTASVIARARDLVHRATPCRVERGDARRRLALAAVVAVEGLELALPSATRRALVTTERVIAREALPERVRTMLPSPWRHAWDPQDPAFERIERTIAADLVVHAKYDLGERVKLRAGYADAGLVLGVLPMSHLGVCGVSRTVAAHAIVGRHAPDLAPGLVAFGETGDAGRYVVEQWVDGRPLMTAVRLARAVPEIVDGLGRVHRGHGSRRVRLSRWAPDLAAQWDALRGTGLVPASLTDAVADLIARDATLRCSWTHGDPVSSNVMATDAGIVLIDWENASTAPVMVDGAKLHLFADDPQATLATVLEGLTGAATGAGRSAYAPHEELALVHARRLTGHPRRTALLVGHPHEEANARQGRRGVERLAAALTA